MVRSSGKLPPLVVSSFMLFNLNLPNVNSLAALTQGADSG
jgi:hypothetical protein